MSECSKAYVLSRSYHILVTFARNFLRPAFKRWQTTRITWRVKYRLRPAPFQTFFVHSFQTETLRDNLRSITQEATAASHVQCSSAKCPTAHTVSQRSSSLHTNHLLQRVNYIHQVTLCCHDVIDVLVSHWCFVNHVSILTTLHVSCRLHVIVNCEHFLGFSSWHDTAGTVATAKGVFKNLLT